MTTPRSFTAAVRHPVSKVPEKEEMILEQTKKEFKLQPVLSTTARLLKNREISLVLIIAVIAIILSNITRSFASLGNMRVLLQGMSTDMMIAIPMAISLIAGNIDFSVGSTLCLSSAITALALNSGMPVGLAIAIGLTSGALLGVFNAIIVCQLRLTPLVATLGTWMAYRGIALVLLGGGTLSRFPDSFLVLGRTAVFGIPITIIYMAIIMLLGLFSLHYVVFFHNAYFIGSNKHSATLAGIDRVKFTYVMYAITGLVAAFAGIILAARLGSSSQNAGSGLEFRIVVGLLVGGVSMDGGEGNLRGVILGVALMQLVSNAIILLYLNPSYTQVINGFILVLSVAVDMLSKQKKGSVA